jgi:protein-tyrosine kinase
MSTIEKAVEKLGQSQASQDTEGELNLSVSQSTPLNSDFLLDNEDVPDDVGILESAMELAQPELIQTNSGQSKSNKDTFYLPIPKLEAMGFVSPNNPRSQIAEEFRGIKRPLLMNIDGKGVEQVENANLIMVTSSVQGEGKTFSAINLMLSISMEKDKTVLFVDADVAKASAGKALGIPDDAPGLIDVIEHEDIGFEEVILPTNIPNVKVIPAGKVNEHSTELLASERMQYLMKELSIRYPDRIIIFDSPPFLQTSEASVLANFMGQIMFVVESEKTSPDMVSQAVSQIGDDKIVGMVLNKTRKYPWDQHLHGYGYGYGYGYGADRTRVTDTQAS